MNVADGARELIVPMAEDEEANPRLSAIAWTPDGSGIYATWAARDQWQRGIVRIDVAAKTMTPIVRDARLYSGAQLSRDGSTFVYTMSDGDRPAELHAADAAVRRHPAPQRSEPVDRVESAADGPSWWPIATSTESSCTASFAIRLAT